LSLNLKDVYNSLSFFLFLPFIIAEITFFPIPQLYFHGLIDLQHLYYNKFLCILLVLCDHEAMFQVLEKAFCRNVGKDCVYVRSKVVGPFPRPSVSGSYLHQAATFILLVLPRYKMDVT
jgi:hypothetical protein